MIEAVIGFVLLAGSVWVLMPLFGDRRPTRPGNDQLEGLLEQKSSILAALADFESDAAQGKVAGEAHDSIRAELETQAAEVLQREDAYKGVEQPADALEAEIAQTRRRLQK